MVTRRVSEELLTPENPRSRVGLPTGANARRLTGSSKNQRPFLIRPPAHLPKMYPANEFCPAKRSDLAHLR